MGAKSSRKIFPLASAEPDAPLVIKHIRKLGGELPAAQRLLIPTLIKGTPGKAVPGFSHGRS